MPASFATAIRSHYGSGIQQTRPKISGESITNAMCIPSIMNALPKTDKIEEIVTRSNGVMTRVLMVNTTLRQLRIDCAHLDSLAVTGISQLTDLQEMVRVQNRPGVQSVLYQFRGTVTSLRDTYREVLVREDLPGETAQGVLSVAQSLDITAVRTGMA